MTVYQILEKHALRYCTSIYEHFINARRHGKHNWGEQEIKV